MKKRLKIIGYILIIVLILVDLWIVVGFTRITESEYGRNELQEYYGCGQESEFTRVICLGRGVQKNIIIELGEKILP